MRKTGDVWYATRCGYWTDDWDALKSHAVPNQDAIQGGIPCCPECGDVGFQTSAAEWFAGVSRFNESNPGYAAFIDASRGKCRRAVGGLAAAWRAYQVSKMPGDSPAAP